MNRPLLLASIFGGLSLGLIHCVTNPSLGAGAGQGAVQTGDASVDAPLPPAAEAGTPISEAGLAISCADLVAQMLKAPIAPPSGYAGFDLTRGQNPKGLSFDEANAAGCATLDPSQRGGYRTAHWGTAVQGITAYYNMESRLIYSFELGDAYTGTVRFQSRAGGSYGTHSYEIGAGKVLRDGADLPLDWTEVDRTTWNELYDGMMASFAPTVTGAPNACTSGGACLILPDDGLGRAIFGVRPLHFYILAPAGTNKVNAFYNFWDGGKADCSTPTAALEAMDDSSIFGFSGGSGGATGPYLGGLDLSRPHPNGLTWQAADAINCNGKQVTASDPGYGAIQWGPAGELTLEYNKTTNIAYKAIATAGYRGTIDAYDGTTKYSLGIGKLTKDGAPFTVDWANAVPFASLLANNLNTTSDADCVVATSCVVTPDDGQGHSVLAFPSAELTIVFPTGTSAAQSITGVWANGK